MPAFCGAVNCGNRGDRDHTKHFFRLPAVLKRGSALKIKLSALRRKKWISALKRADLTESKLQWLRICEDHFVTGKPSLNMEHPDYVPSIFNFSKSALLNGKKQIERFERNAKRQKFHDNAVQGKPPCDVNHPDYIPSNSKFSKPSEIFERYSECKMLKDGALQDISLGKPSHEIKHPECVSSVFYLSELQMLNGKNKTERFEINPKHKKLDGIALEDQPSMSSDSGDDLDEINHGSITSSSSIDTQPDTTADILDALRRENLALRRRVQFLEEKLNSADTDDK